MLAELIDLCAGRVDLCAGRVDRLLCTRLLWSSSGQVDLSGAPLPTRRHSAVGAFPQPVDPYLNSSCFLLLVRSLHRPSRSSSGDSTRGTPSWLQASCATAQVLCAGYLLTSHGHQKGASLEVVTHFQEGGDLSLDLSEHPNKLNTHCQSTI